MKVREKRDGPALGNLLDRFESRRENSFAERFQMKRAHEDLLRPCHGGERLDRPMLEPLSSKR